MKLRAIVERLRMVAFSAKMAACAVLLLADFCYAATVPEKPANVVATTNRTDGIRLTWDAVDGASYYILYRYGGQTSQTGLVQTKVTGLSHLDTSCEAGANIPYRIRAFNSSGVGGAYSAYVRGYRKVLLEPYIGGYVSVNPLANGGTAQPLKVRCNVDWTAKASDWINLNSGAFERSNEATELGFSLEPNTTGTMREGTITVYAGQESATLKVLQGAVSVPDYDTWCGDSALAIIEDAAFPEEFLFRTEYTGGFVSYPDETATGGSCLRSSPIDVNGRAVVSWKMPSAWKLRFRWRKDTAKSADVLSLYAGDFVSDGTPNLSSAAKIATCSSTSWDYVEVSSLAAPGKQALFFVYEKKSGGTSGTASGFGFIDDFLLMTAPREISFAPPTRFIGDAYSLNLPCDATQTVATEVTFSHTVTYGGVEHPVKGIVYPTWQAIGSNYYLNYAPGVGADANKTVFSSKEVGSPQNVMLQASYEVAGESVWEDLTVTITPPALGALDCRSSGVSVGSAMDWGWKSDISATNGSCIFCAAPYAGSSRSFSIRFDGLNQFSGVARNLFSFNYKMQSCASDESVFCVVDGSPTITLPATGDTDWHRVSIFIPDTSRSHEVTWTYAKSGYAYSGSGVSIDFVEIEELPTSLVVNSFDQTVNVADYVVSEGSCSMSVLKGDDWMSCLPVSTYSGETAVQLSTSLAFDVGLNETWDARGGKLRIVAGGGTNFLYVVQSATADTMVEDLAIQPTVYDIVEGVPVSFTASFTLGGQPATDFVDLEWTHDFGDAATLEDGVLTVETSERIRLENIACKIGNRWDSLQIKAHPPVSLLAPEGMTFTAADGWWVEDGYNYSTGRKEEDMPYLKTDVWGARYSSKTLTATVTGPALVRCEGKGLHATGFYVDGKRQGGVSGSDWTEALVEIPEGEHEISFVYEKADYEGVYDDVGWIRNITLTPLVFDGYALQGPERMTSGAKGSFRLFEKFRDAESGYVAAFPMSIYETKFATFSISAGDSRTASLVDARLYYEEEIILRVPLSVQWSDTLSLSLLVDFEQGIYASCQVAVSAESLAGLLDSNIADMTIPYSYNSDVSECLAQDDDTAVGGRCLALVTTDWWSPATLAVKVLDEGMLTFNYKLMNDSVITVTVDGNEAEYRTSENGGWTIGLLQIAGAGPHDVQIQLRPSDYYSREGLGYLDNVYWRQGATYSRITGARVTGDAIVGLGVSATSYSFSIDGVVSDGGGSSYSTNWMVAPYSWDLQFVSGDRNALEMGWSYGSDCQLNVGEMVTSDSVFSLVGRYAIGGNTYVGSLDISVPARTPIEDAIFDSGTYANCLYAGEYGWQGTFSDHSSGTSCAQCLTPEVGSDAAFGLSVYGKGTLAFDWKVSCAADDELLFYKDYGMESDARITGTTGWQHVTITFGDEEDRDQDGRPLMHQCVWRFVKNSAASAGSNCAWVDNVTWSGTTPLPISRGEVAVETNLRPGDTATVEITFYRGSGQQIDWTPATGDDVPAIESVTLYNFDNLELERFVSSGKDKFGNYAITVDSECSATGWFCVDVGYTLYGEKQVSYSYVYVEEGRRGGASMLGARSSKMMAANGINTVGECLVAGLDPDDADAKFTTYVTMTNGVPYITWSPNLPDRTYIIKGKASLSDPKWIAPTNSTHRFFRVEIETDK